jgi:hypothetical protein
MRKLIYVPIIHTEADLGGLAEDIVQRTRAIVGANNWQKHTEVVRLYWQAIASYWKGKNVAGFKIFQDGMPADGDVGKNIVKEVANKGSVNYKVVEHLMGKGAILVKTEDPELLREEYLLNRELAKSASFLGSITAIMKYRWRKDKLLKERDKYIATRIAENLAEGETGVCFLGAYHHIFPNLPEDIQVVPLKDPQKVSEYSQKFASGKDENDVNTLGEYLVAPIKVTSGENHE